MNGTVPADGERSNAAGAASERTRPPRDAHAVLDLRRPFRAAIPDSSVGSVRKVARLDAQTHVIAARQPGGSWYRLRERTRFTRDAAERLRMAGVSEVVLRRGFARASFPLSWLSQRSS